MEGCINRLMGGFFFVMGFVGLYFAHVATRDNFVSQTAFEEMDWFLIIVSPLFLIVGGAIAFAPEGSKVWNLLNRS